MVRISPGTEKALNLAVNNYFDKSLNITKSQIVNLAIQDMVSYELTPFELVANVLWQMAKQLQNLFANAMIQDYRVEHGGTIEEARKHMPNFTMGWETIRNKQTDEIKSLTLVFGVCYPDQETIWNDDMKVDFDRRLYPVIKYFDDLQNRFSQPIIESEMRSQIDELTPA